MPTKRDSSDPSGLDACSHMRSWPKKYADWADGDPQSIGEMKGFTISNRNGAVYLVESVELQDCLKNNWPNDLHHPIRSLLWSTFTAFTNSIKGGCSEVTHAHFINVLDEWLVTHSAPEHEYSN